MREGDSAHWATSSATDRSPEPPPLGFCGGHAAQLCLRASRLEQVVASRFKPRFGWVLGGMLLVEIVVRLAYVAAQSRTDPWFIHPSGDPADTLMWAWEIVTGEGMRDADPSAPGVRGVRGRLIQSLKPARSRSAYVFLDSAIRWW